MRIKVPSSVPAVNWGVLHALACQRKGSRRLGNFAAISTVASAVFETGAKLPYHRMMESLQRYLAAQLIRDLDRKMVFVAADWPK